MTTEEKAKAYADKKIKSTYGISSKAFREAGCRLEYEDVVQAYEDGATEALASQWVSVEERLPEEGQEVLLYDVNSIRHYVIGWRRKKGDNKSMWALSNGFVEDKDITHWLPIPPLKGGDA